MQWRAMGMRETLAYRDDLFDAFARNRPHTHNDRSIKGTCPSGLQSCAIHWDSLIFINMTQREACSEERSLETERTSNGKTNEVILPKVENVLNFLCKSSVLMNAILWEIKPQIKIRIRIAEVQNAGLSSSNKGARLRIFLAKGFKICSVAFGQYNQIRLQSPCT